MREFELKLDNTVYQCKPSSYSQENCNWHITSKVNDVSVTMTIPVESKVSRSQLMLFVEIFHEALMAAKKEQKEVLHFPQQLT